MKLLLEAEAKAAAVILKITGACGLTCIIEFYNLILVYPRPVSVPFGPAEPDTEIFSKPGTDTKGTCPYISASVMIKTRLLFYFFLVLPVLI